MPKRRRVHYFNVDARPWFVTPAEQAYADSFNTPVVCVCTDSCPESWEDNKCAYCRELDIYDPCPVIGFGCGSDCDDLEHCTLEQRKAADS